VHLRVCPSEDLCALKGLGDKKDKTRSRNVIKLARGMLDKTT